MHNNLIQENFDESFLRLPSLIDERKKAFSELKKIGLDENYKIGLDIDGDGKPDFGLSLKTIGGIIFAIISLAGVWFSLKADIALAKELPEPLPPDVTRMEFDMKDQLIRQTIMSTQEDVKEIKDDLKAIKQKLYE